MSTWNYTDYLSALIDISIPFALLADISIYLTFGNKKSNLCPIFLNSMRNMFLCNIEIYLVEIFIKEPANFGYFQEFWLQYGWWIGKLVFATSTAIGNAVTLFALIIGISRLWCVWAPINFKKVWNSKCISYVSTFVWSWTAGLSLHIFIFVDCRAYPKTNTSLTFNTITPNIIHTLMSAYGKTIFQFAVIFCYIILAIVLWRYSVRIHIHQPTRGNKLWTKTTKKIVISQVLIVTPKMFATGFLLYAQIQAFFPQWKLTPLNLELYYLVLKFGSVGYGIIASVVILFCFPKTWSNLKRRLIYPILPKFLQPTSWKEDSTKIEIPDVETWTVHPIDRQTVSGIPTNSNNSTKRARTRQRF